MPKRGPHRCLLHVAGQYTVCWPQRDVGRKTFHVRVRDEFSGHVIKLGTGQQTPRKAQQVARIWAERQAQVSTVTQQPLAQAIEEWLNVQTARDVTLRTYTAQLHSFDRFLHHPLTSAITPSQVQQFLSTKEAAGTRQNYISVLRAFFKWTVERGYSHSDPTLGAKPGRKPRFIGKSLTSSEAAALVAACPGALKTAVLIALYTGLRRGNVTTLKWGDLNLEARTLFIPASRTKNHSDLHLPIHKDLAAYLMPLRSRPTDLVVNGPTYHFKAIAHSIRPMRFHDLRHSFVSALNACTRNYALVRRLRGDVVDDVARHYIHFSPDELQQAVDLLPWVGPSHPSAAPATPPPSNTSSASRLGNRAAPASSPSPGSASASRTVPRMSEANEYTL